MTTFSAAVMSFFLPPDIKPSVALFDKFAPLSNLIALALMFIGCHKAHIGKSRIFFGDLAVTDL
jgi:hypothetical protein